MWSGRKSSSCYLERALRSCCDSWAANSRWQHGPGGMGAPCGQVRGWPRKVQILSVASGERMCSNLQACCSISDSLSMRQAVGKQALGQAMTANDVSRALPASWREFHNHAAVASGNTSRLERIVAGIHERLVVVRFGRMRPGGQPRPRSIIFSIAMLTGSAP